MTQRDGRASDGAAGSGAPPVLAEGRTATVVLLDERTVAKVDKPGWEGLAAFELGLLRRLSDLGLAVPRPVGMVEVDGRPALAMERLVGPTLAEHLAGADDAAITGAAADLLALQVSIHRARPADLDDLVGRLRREAADAGFADLAVPEGGPPGLCHADLNPQNVIVTDGGLRVVDWLTAADGPLAAEVARTWVLLAEPVPGADPNRLRLASRYRGLVEEHPMVGPDPGAWVRLAAAARVAEGFTDERVAWLRDVATGGW